MEICEISVQARSFAFVSKLRCLVLHNYVNLQGLVINERRVIIWASDKEKIKIYFWCRTKNFFVGDKIRGKVIILVLLFQDLHNTN